MQKLPAILGIILCSAAFAACGGESAVPTASSVDPLTGIDTTQVLISQEELDQTADIRLTPFRSGNKWGFADANLNLVIEADYDYVDPFFENLAIVRKGGVFGVIDKRGRAIIPPRFERITRSACGVMTIKTDSGYVLVNHTGKRVTRQIYQGAFSYTCSEGRIPVVEAGKIGFLDKNGRQVVPCKYDAFHRFSDGVAPARLGNSVEGKWGVLDQQGNEVIPFAYETIFPFTDGLAVAVKEDSTGNERWGVINKWGEAVIPFEFGAISGQFRGEYIVCKAFDPVELYLEGLEDEYNTWYIYDRQGRQTGKSSYELSDDFSDGRVVLRQGNQYGYADATGKIVIAPAYDHVCPFSQGVAWVGKDSLYGFINPSGEVVVPLKYAPAGEYLFMEEWGAWVTDAQTGEEFFVDKAGKEFKR
ncbi:MAG: WG repeat-containing protein [Bacteroidota bacterium]